MDPINWAALRVIDSISAEIFATPEPSPPTGWVYQRPRSPAAQEMIDARQYARDDFEREILTWEAERLDAEAMWSRA